MTPQEAAEQYATTKSYMDGKDIKGSAIATFIAGAQWQSEQDNHALSSALKEIAELHAKVKQLETDLYHAEGNLEIANRRVNELESKPNNFM